MLSSGRARAFAFVCISILALTGLAATAEDWPEWRGKGRIGVWTETGIVDRFPDGGPPVRWRTPITRATRDRRWRAAACSSPTHGA